MSNFSKIYLQPSLYRCPTLWKALNHERKTNSFPPSFPSPWLDLLPLRRTRFTAIFMADLLSPLHACKSRDKKPEEEYNNNLPFFGEGEEEEEEVDFGSIQKGGGERES